MIPEREAEVMSEENPSLIHHYMLVPAVQVLMILALAWISAHFR